MPQSDVHYRLPDKPPDRPSAQIELIDLPFPARSYRVRVNGESAKELPVASKTAVMRQLRSWWVAH